MIEGVRLWGGSRGQGRIPSVWTWTSDDGAIMMEGG